MKCENEDLLTLISTLGKIDLFCQAKEQAVLKFSSLYLSLPLLLPFCLFLFVSFFYNAKHRV